MDRTRVTQLAATVLCIGLAATLVRAHHSHGMFYDPCKYLTLEGRLESIQWKDPHILFELRLDDGTSYHGEWIGMRELMNRGTVAATQAALTFGARVVIGGNLLRQAAEIRANFADYKEDTRGPNLIDVHQIRRTDNSWSWQRETPTCTRK